MKQVLFRCRGHGGNEARYSDATPTVGARVQKSIPESALPSSANARMAAVGGQAETTIPTWRRCVDADGGEHTTICRGDVG